MGCNGIHISFGENASITLHYKSLCIKGLKATIPFKAIIFCNKFQNPFIVIKHPRKRPIFSTVLWMILFCLLENCIAGRKKSWCSVYSHNCHLKRELKTFNPDD